MIARKELERMYWQEGKSQQKIAKETGLLQARVHCLMVKFGIPRRSKSEASRWVEVNMNPSENLSYVLGVIKGDGCVCIGENKGGHTWGRVILTQIHPKFAESFENALKNLGFNSNTFIQKKSNCTQGFVYCTYGTSLRFARWYKQLSLEDIGEIIGDSADFIKGFIRGFYESEGYNSIRTNQRKNLVWTIGFGNTDEKLSLFVLGLLSKLKFNFHFYADLHHVSEYSSKPYFMIYNSKKYENLRFINEIQPCFRNQIIENPPLPKKINPTNHNKKRWIK